MRHGFVTSAVAYLNVDSAASGPNLSIAAVPALNHLIEDVTRDRPRSGFDGHARRPRPRSRQPGTRRPADGIRRARLIDNRLGSGSDYTVFLNFLGVPVADLSFDGPVRRLPLDLRQPSLGRDDRRSGLPLSRRARAALGAPRAAARASGCRPARLCALRRTDRRLRERGRAAMGRTGQRRSIRWPTCGRQRPNCDAAADALQHPRANRTYEHADIRP